MNSSVLADDYTYREAYILRVISLVASCFSIVAVIATFIWWIFFHSTPKDRKFRHALIWSVLFCDVCKAGKLIIYPVKYLNSTEKLDGRGSRPSLFCDFIGFLTELTIEGSDLAVFLLAVHTALIIFCPTFGNGEGLYRFRHSIVLISTCAPLVIAGLGLIHIIDEVDSTYSSGYTHFTTWCYLRIFPVWYRWCSRGVRDF